MKANRRSVFAVKLVGGVGALLAVVLLFVPLIWWRAAQEDPVVHIPARVVPIPNAFDTFRSATSQIVDGFKIEYALQTRHDTGLKVDRDYTWAEKQTLVSENRAALELLTTGFDMENLYPPSPSYFARLPFRARFYSAFELLALEADVRAHQGDYAGAVRCNMDAIAFGGKIQQRAKLDEWMLGAGCQSSGRRPMWARIDRLTALEARDAVGRFERIRSALPTLAETLQEEKWCGQASLSSVMKNPALLYVPEPGAGTTPEPIPANLTTLSQLGFLIHSKRRIMDDYSALLDAHIANAKRPYGAAMPVSPPKDLLLEFVAPGIMLLESNGFRAAFARSEAQSGLLEISLALRAFRAEHGHYPAALGELTPSILPALPPDPFAKSGSFGYGVIGVKYVLYSVGPDRKDDGGRAIDTSILRHGHPNDRYIVMEDSKGDIVAGKNIW